MARPAAALIFGLVLGGAAGAAIVVGVGGVLGGSPAGAPLDIAAKGARPPAEASATEATISAPAGAEAAGLAAPTRVADAPDEGAAAPPELIAEAAELARRAPAPSQRRGGRSIRGRVADLEGHPLAGVVIRARRLDESGRTPGRSRAGEAAPAGESLDHAVRASVEAWYQRQSDRRETTTDAGGAFAFGDLRDGQWWLDAWAEGFDLELVDVPRNGITPDATVELKATPIVRVRVAIALPDGRAAAKAAVQSRKAGEKGFRRTEGWSAEEPSVPLAPGTWEVRASLGDPETGPPWPDALVSDVSTITTATGTAPPELSFRLHGSPGIRGRIRLPPGGSRPYVLVKVQPLPAGAAPDLKVLASDHEATNVWSHDSTYVFRDLAPGRYVVGVSRNWGDRIASHAVVEVRDSMVEQDLDVPPLDPARCLVVRVTGPDDQPLENVTFQLRTEQDGGSSSRGVEAERKATGNFWVPLDTASDEADLLAPWPAGRRAFVVANAEGFGEKSAEIAQGTRALQIQFTRPASLVVTVVGFVGSGLEGRLHLSLVREGSDGNRSYSSQASGLGADGTQKFGPVEAGRWRLALELQPSSGNRWERQEIAALDVTLATGENAATISVPPVYSLTVEFAEGSGGYAQIRLVGASEMRTRSTQLDDSGRFTFEGLTAGDYDVMLMGGSEPGMMRVRVPSPGPVRFVASPVNALSVRIAKADGKLAQAGLRDGDMIVAIDGKEFSNMLELQANVATVLSRKEVTFTVERGRERVDIKLDGRMLMKPQELGGTIEPTTR